MDFRRIILAASLALSASAKCFEPSPAFPVPKWPNGGRDLRPALLELETKLSNIVSQSKYDNSSYSVEITSSKETLWTNSHTAKNLNKTRPGDTQVGSSSQFRIASITKVFTTLAVLYQAKAENLSLDDPVSKYIDELNSEEYLLPWKDITLRILASQLSGIPREFAQSDALNLIEKPWEYGFPPIAKEEAPGPNCDEYNHYKPCTAADLLTRLKAFKPLFAPNQKSTYSNLNYEILGLVLESVTGVPYEEYIHDTIFAPLEMKFATFQKPTDDHAVLPVGNNYWDIEAGVQAPTGGIYASSSDLSKFLRYVLTHYNTLTTGVNWFLPGSWSTGLYSFYGMPWEIFRTDKILTNSRRPITFVGKSGGLPGYYSRITLLEEYGLGITILVGGSVSLLDDVLEAVTLELVRAAEETVWKTIDDTYTAWYVADAPLNSSLELAVSATKGLHIPIFISNNTDIISTLFSELPSSISEPTWAWYLQLVPTLLYQNESTREGEIWRALVVNDMSEAESTRIWDDFCVTDVDQVTYAGLPINEVILWHEKGILELPGFRLKLKKSGDSKFLVQSS